ncbi:hypothetical protein Ahy_A08g038287 isoform B [Arachis hypogaea]|uniref:Pectin acetylesterase n=1 Tax=Arachis hypogaea TaxID=3818 RepID=A0A445BT40_ARAHY|nr:hypothetical protein Ahy_A08g038287 isoform B [Arachis hypogaea]
MSGPSVTQNAASSLLDCATHVAAGENSWVNASSRAIRSDADHRSALSLPLISTFSILSTFFPSRSCSISISISSRSRSRSCSRSISILDGASKFNFTVQNDGGQVTLKTKIVTAKITVTLIDEDPLAIYTIDKVLLPRELFKALAPSPSPAPAPEPAAVDAPASPKKEGKKKKQKAADAPADEESAPADSPSDAADDSADDGNGAVRFDDGGEWCNDVSTCLQRKDTRLGSSKQMDTQSGFNGILNNQQVYNPDFYNWNRIKIRYCNGSSFTGDVEEVDLTTNLHFRGARIFEAVIKHLLAKGMENAKNGILSGCSAGGLAAILNYDRFKSFLPNGARVKCVPDAGYFIHIPYVSGTKHIENFYNGVVETHGSAKYLSKSCTSKYGAGLVLLGIWVPENPASFCRNGPSSMGSVCLQGRNKHESGSQQFGLENIPRSPGSLTKKRLSSAEDMLQYNELTRLGDNSLYSWPESSKYQYHEKIFIFMALWKFVLQKLVVFPLKLQNLWLLNNYMGNCLDKDL